MKIKPNLYIVGFQRCGSSTLFELLAKHPEVVGSKPKETFALSDRIYQHFNFEKSLKNSNFKWDLFYQVEAENSNTKYLLEGSVINFYQKTALDYISNYPDSKVIFIIRDPIDRFVSNYKYYASTGVHIEPSTGINDYFTTLKKGKYNNQEGLTYSLEHGQYVRYLKLWEKKISRSRIFVLSLEQLSKDSDKTLFALFNFLGIKKHNIGIPHKNKSKSMKLKRMHRFLVHILGPLNLKMNFLRRIYFYWNFSEIVREPEIEKRYISELKEFYKVEYEQLGDYFI